MKNTDLITIGQLAKLSGVGVEAIRFYERQGILPKAKRKPSGYRLYGPETAERLRFVRELQDHGFSLKEAGAIAGGRDVRGAIQHIDDRIQKLRALQRRLAKAA